MKLKSIIAASVFATSLLALGTLNSYALPQTIDLSSGVASFTASGTSVLITGQDILTFYGITSPGTYNFDFSMSSQNTIIDNVFVNTQAATNTGFGTFRFFGLNSVDSSPFIVEINGSAGTATPLSAYSGQLSVSAVPEAGTYLLLLAGLGMVCLAARYRKIA